MKVISFTRSDTMDIKGNIENLRTEIVNLCKLINRDPKEINIIAVTKTVDSETILKAINYGINIIGENKVQELLGKYDDLKDKAEIHLIGHLQTNKVKYIIDKVKLIHSLDSVKLAKEISKRCKSINRIMDTLVQINIGGEETKYGISPKNVYDFIMEVSTLDNINIKGLMTIAPYFENPELTRPYFRQMKEIFDTLKTYNLPNVEMKYLSMGMTNDYKIAIEEGSNMIRIGTGIFGERNYNN